MPALNSNCLAWVEYDSGTVHLRFRHGHSSTLHGVREYHYSGLLNASSPGRYFNTFLKGGCQP